MNIYLICTGNTCRSPLAEAIFRSYELPNVQVRSAGIHAVDNAPISDNSKQIIEAANMPYTNTSHQVTEANIDWATHIFTMTENHRNVLRQMFPHAQEKIVTLKEFIQSSRSYDISDPFGGSLEMYENTYYELQEVIDKAIGKLRGGNRI